MFDGIISGLRGKILRNVLLVILAIVIIVGVVLALIPWQKNEVKDYYDENIAELSTTIDNWFDGVQETLIAFDNYPDEITDTSGISSYTQYTADRNNLYTNYNSLYLRYLDLGEKVKELRGLDYYSQNVDFAKKVDALVAKIDEQRQAIMATSQLIGGVSLCFPNSPNEINGQLDNDRLNQMYMMCDENIYSTLFEYGSDATKNFGQLAIEYTADLKAMVDSGDTSTFESKTIKIYSEYNKYIKSQSATIVDELIGVQNALDELEKSILN